MILALVCSLLSTSSFLSSLLSCFCSCPLPSSASVRKVARDREQPNQKRKRKRKEKEKERRASENTHTFLILAPHTRASDAVPKHDELGETDEQGSFRVSSRCFFVKEGSFVVLDDESAATTKPSRSSSTDRCGCCGWKRVQSLGRCQEQQEKNRSEEDHDHRCRADCHRTGNYSLFSSFSSPLIVF
jgi:hypothetical protein